MGRIDTIFTALRAEGGRALMPFITGGHPTTAATTAMLEGFADAGAAIAEVGLPFSDPIADGPVIAGAMHDVLHAGTTIDDVLRAVRTAKAHTDMGLVAMVSHSIVHRRGDGDFIKQLADAGFDGIIVPDADLVAIDALLPTIDALQMSCSLLIAPTTTPARIEALVQRCRGFVYLLARAGITGQRSSMDGLDQRVNTIRQYTDLPIAVGFGIDSSAAVAQAVEACDAAIVGSALVKAIDTAQDPVKTALDTVTALATGLPTLA
ncbi:MAG: tryptophan synthase subunit alpha [Phycisphaerales bacterium]|nr:tryptophan synthase subunit alpha [Phycisphaerales bacterium]